MDGYQASVGRAGRAVAGVSVLVIGSDRSYGINAGRITQYLVAEGSYGGANYGGVKSRAAVVGDHTSRNAEG